jgi:nucleoside-diphosphate-sugar epimerase
MGQPQSILSASYSFLTQNEEPEILFETVIAHAIDDVLSALGDASKQAIYRHLKNNYGINENEIPYKIEDFARAIEQTFGSVAKLIEIKIIERLHAKYKDFSYVPEKGELNFVEFVYNLQHRLQLEA